MAISTAAAIAGAAVIGAGASIYGASKAAKAQKKAAKSAANTERYFYDTARADQAPWREAGGAAVKTYADLLGVGTGGESASGKTLYDHYVKTPDYDFRFNEGMRAVNSTLAAQGKTLSGPRVKALTRYGAGVAGQGTGQFADRLAALAGLGQSSANATQQAGSQAAQGIAGAQTAAGDARASSYLTGANAISGLTSNLAYMAMMRQPQQSGGFGSMAGVPGAPYTGPLTTAGTI